MSEHPGPWTKLDRHLATGREAFWRIDDAKARANFEYRVTITFEVREADGTHIGKLTRFMDWENSTSIHGKFNENGSEILFQANIVSDLSETLSLAPKAAH